MSSGSESGDVAARASRSQALGVPATVRELLERVGIDGGEVKGADLPHNRWLSPGVWQVRTRAGQLAVLKYATSDRSQGETAWDAHWTARDRDPARWTYWAREPLAYQQDLPGAYAGSGIVAPVCLAVTVSDRDAVLLLQRETGTPGGGLAGHLLPPGGRSARPGSGAVPPRPAAAAFPVAEPVVPARVQLREAGRLGPAR